jgi:AcrR family transcriptional regulator
MTPRPAVTAPAASALAAAVPAAPHAASAREQLVRHATAIFATKGYAAASTREICDAAGVNVAAIHYYFGDKEGLYREALLRPIAEVTAAFGRFDDPTLPFEAAMTMFLAPFIDPGQDRGAGGADAAFEADVMKLHLREMLEPSAAFREIVDQVIAPAHRALSQLIARHCGVARPDDDIHQLGFAMVAMANDYCMSREFMKMLAPGVLNRPQARQRILDRLVGYARALLDHEIARRREAAPPARAKSRTSPNRSLESRHVPTPAKSSPRKPRR